MATEWVVPENQGPSGGVGGGGRTCLQISISTLHPIAQAKVPFSGRLNVEGKMQGPGGRGHGGRDAAIAQRLFYTCGNEAPAGEMTVGVLHGRSVNITESHSEKVIPSSVLFQYL